MSKELAKTYDPKGIEERLYQKWMDNGYFHAKVNPDKKPFTIVMRNLHSLLCGIFHHGILRNCHNRFSNFSPYKSPADRKSHVLDTSLRTFHSSGRQTLLSLHSYL